MFQFIPRIMYFVLPVLVSSRLIPNVSLMSAIITRCYVSQIDMSQLVESNKIDLYKKPTNGNDQINKHINSSVA